MPLPILQVHSQPSQADLIRFYHKIELNWARHLGEETALDVGTAICNPQIAEVRDANRVMDVALPERMSAAAAMELVEGHFSQQGARCWKWIMSPGAPESATKPLVELLLERGYPRRRMDIMYLNHRPAGTIAEAGGLTIIPARASYRHVRELAEESAREWGTPQLVEASVMHLDDPHVDALLALKDTKAVGKVYVLAVGEIGSIEHVFVSAPFRGQGIGRTLISRAMEICARSLFKHVFLSVDPENAAAIALYAKFGFEKIGDFESYVAQVS